MEGGEIHWGCMRDTWEICWRGCVGTFGRRGIESVGHPAAQTERLVRVVDGPMLRKRLADNLAVVVGRGNVRHRLHRVDDRTQEGGLLVVLVADDIESIGDQPETLWDSREARGERLW